MQAEHELAARHGMYVHPDRIHSPLPFAKEKKSVFEFLFAFNFGGSNVILIRTIDWFVDRPYVCVRAFFFPLQPPAPVALPFPSKPGGPVPSSAPSHKPRSDPTERQHTASLKAFPFFCAGKAEHHTRVTETPVEELFFRPQTHQPDRCLDTTGIASPRHVGRPKISLRDLLTLPASSSHYRPLTGASKV
jgi:hypothetical protein